MRGFEYYRQHSDIAFDAGLRMRGLAYSAFNGENKGYTRSDKSYRAGYKYWYLQILLFNYVHTFSYHKEIKSV